MIMVIALLFTTSCYPYYLTDPDTYSGRYQLRIESDVDWQGNIDYQPVSGYGHRGIPIYYKTCWDISKRRYEGYLRVFVTTQDYYYSSYGRFPIWEERITTAPYGRVTGCF